MNILAALSALVTKPNNGISGASVQPIMVVAQPSMFDQMINVLIGIVCSLIAWWIVFHIFRPKLHIRRKITIRPTDGNHRLRVENVGSRGLVNWTCNARFEFRGMDAGQPTLWNYVKIPTNIEWEPHLAAGSNRIIVFRPELLKRDSSPFEKKLVEQIKVEKITFSDLFKQGVESRLRFSLHGYDAFSGAARVFEHEFSPDDLTEIGQSKLPASNFKPYAEFGLKYTLSKLIKRFLALFAFNN